MVKKKTTKKEEIYKPSVSYPHSTTKTAYKWMPKDDLHRWTAIFMDDGVPNMRKAPKGFVWINNNRGEPAETTRHYEEALLVDYNSVIHRFTKVIWKGIGTHTKDGRTEKFAIIKSKTWYGDDYYTICKWDKTERKWKQYFPIKSLKDGKDELKERGWEITPVKTSASPRKAGKHLRAKKRAY